MVRSIILVAYYVNTGGCDSDGGGGGGGGGGGAAGEAHGRGADAKNEAFLFSLLDLLQLSLDNERDPSTWPVAYYVTTGGCDRDGVGGGAAAVARPRWRRQRSRCYID